MMWDGLDYNVNEIRFAGYFWGPNWSPVFYLAGLAAIYTKNPDERMLRIGD
jgi:hypothetical protein